MNRKFVLLIMMATVAIISNAQVIDPAKRTRQAAENRVNNRVDQGIDKGLDKIEEGIDGLFKKKKNKSDDNTKKEASQTPGKVNSKSDFVPGNSVIFADDFSQDALGDFPVQWNTNGSGEVVTIKGLEGKWLGVVHNSIVNPVMKKALPENLTIEFDLFLKANGQQSTPFIQFGITPVKDILKQDLFYSNRFFINLNRYAESDGQTLEYGLKNDIIGNKSDFPLTRYANKVLHVAIALNKTRIRLYLDGSKLIDLPRAITSDMYHNFFLNNNYVVPASEIPMYVSNIRIAAADVDARSLLVKDLMEKGKASTNAILFDVNSDVIKPSSYPVIQQIGEAMVTNPSLIIKIIGHTDSDGSEGDNLTLSQKRAKAVKLYITENYTISGLRIQTGGKGESNPITSNNSAEGKAKNRRVEFVKI
ncbi:OmpA family protein [Niabella hirudinis]|uniref:OmpA family protein n=1 Tax=Niabella hirudinis TaxID=1285929 RepID=UPI003EB6F4C7